MANEKLLYINWRDANNLGIPIIDEQHKGIVSTINSLFYFSKMGKGEDVLLPIYIIMEQYSILHFETEQCLLKQYNYPEYDDHVMLHVQLLEQLKKLKIQSFVNKDKDAALKFLKEWWLTHINIEDRKYVEWLK